MRIEGRAAPGYDAVAQAFAAAFEEGRPQMGAALALRVGGEVVSLWGWGGRHADWRAVDRQRTSSMIFSCTKGLMSILLALGAGRAAHYDARVASYWPEFAAAGKENVTVRQAISHQAGLNAPPRDWTLNGDLLDWNTATELLAEQAPLWKPGTGYAYHALTHGWLTGELVHRITGIGPGHCCPNSPPSRSTRLRGSRLTDMSGPVAHLNVAPALDALWADMATQDTGGRPNWTYRAMTLGAALPPSLVTADGSFNDRLAAPRSQGPVVSPPQGRWRRSGRRPFARRRAYGCSTTKRSRVPRKRRPRTAPVRSDAALFAGEWAFSSTPKRAVT